MIKRLTNGKYQVRQEFKQSAFANKRQAEIAEKIVATNLSRARRAIVMTPQVEARRQADEFVEAAQPGLSPCLTIREGLRQFLLFLKTVDAVNGQSRRAYERRLIRFAHDLSGGAGDIPLDMISRVDLMIWMEKRLEEQGRRGKTVARATVRKDLDALKRFARWAIKHKGVPRGLDLFYVECLRIERRDGRQAPWLTRKQLLDYLHLIEKESGHVALVLWGMLFFGVRPFAAVRLRWKDVRMPSENEDGYAEFKTLKKGECGRVDVPVGSSREAVLRRASELHRRFYPAVRRRPFHAVFPTERGRSLSNPRGWSPSVFDGEVRRIADRLKLPAWFVPYVVRHTSITTLKKSGLGSTAIRHFAQHRNEKTQHVYDHTSGVDAAPAYDLIEDIFGSDFLPDEGSVNPAGAGDIESALYPLTV